MTYPSIVFCFVNFIDSIFASYMHRTVGVYQQASTACVLCHFSVLLLALLCFFKSQTSHQFLDLLPLDQVPPACCKKVQSNTQRRLATGSEYASVEKSLCQQQQQQQLQYQQQHHHHQSRLRRSPSTRCFSFGLPGSRARPCASGKEPFHGSNCSATTTPTPTPSAAAAAAATDSGLQPTCV